MARRCTSVGKRAVANPTQTLWGMVSNANVRPSLYYLLLGSLATPGDNALEFLLQRFTAPGTASSVVPAVTDTADPTPQTTTFQNSTVEPTYSAGAILLDVPINQRATQLWVALDEADEFKMPAVANNGAGVQPVHASFTGNVTVTAKFQD